MRNLSEYNVKNSQFRELWGFDLKMNRCYLNKGKRENKEGTVARKV